MHFMVKYKFCNNLQGGERTDQVTKEYVDKEILQLDYVSMGPAFQWGQCRLVFDCFLLFGEYSPQ